jgi:hypothetical protein
MAHFAKLGINGKVIAVHAVNDSDILNADGVEDESVGQQFLEKVHGWPAPMWIQTSYNTRAGKHYTLGVDAEGNQTSTESVDQSKALRGNYAGTGMIYDENNIFRSKQPYPSWTLNTTTATWHSPIGDVPALTAEQDSQNLAGTHRWSYYWNEVGQSWDAIDSQA